jgi:DNA polymerase III subunit epsilon
MREIIFDTETTGLDPLVERVIEIGALELENKFPTGRTFHHYIEPEGRKINPDATGIHGITNEMLAGKPIFADIAAAFVDFVADGTLIAHNASFDRSFLNAEFNRLGLTVFPDERYIDTLALARRRHPLGPNSLDALCKRYGIDNSHRTKHGALLDAELLAEVYIEMSGGRQAAFGLEVASSSIDVSSSAQSELRSDIAPKRLGPRPSALASRLTDEEKASHQLMVASLGDDAVWKRYR